MRSSLLRLAAVTVGVIVVLSCDGGPVAPRFGSGIAGGPTGTQPVVPPAPGSVDTVDPFVLFQTPTNGQLVNVGQPILVTLLLNDDRQLSSVDITGFTDTGNVNLGTFVRRVRYPTVTAPQAGFPFQPGQTSATITRFLQPAQPVDSSPGPLLLIAIVRDAGGNVDTAQLTLQLVTGPAVTIIAPPAGIQIGQGATLTVTARVQHNTGVREVRFNVRGEPTWPAAAQLNVDDTVQVGGTRDTTISRNITIPAGAPVGGIVTIDVSARDVNGNPAAAPTRTITVRAVGTTPPTVTQVVPDRLELGDSITVEAIGDNITTVGVTVREADTDTLIVTRTVPVGPSGNVTQPIVLNLPTAAQGLNVEIFSFATDQAGLTGFSVVNQSSAPQTLAGLAFINRSLVVFGLTYSLPRAGVVGDIAVDGPRGHVLISNMTANRLEVWQNSVKGFDDDGVAVGSQPWGLDVSIDPNVLLVANSGGTNISRVNLGTGTVASIQEDLNARIRTRTNFTFVHAEGFDEGAAVKFSGRTVKMFSDRPQFIGQLSDGTIFFSTRPTPVAPAGTVRYLNPAQPFPDLRTFVFVKSVENTVDNYVLVDIDSTRVRPGGTVGVPDTLYLFDHRPGTNLPSDVVKAPTCRDPALGGVIPGRTNCIAPATSDPRFDPRFPGGLPQGTLNAAVALRTYDAACSPNCSDITVIEDADPVGITDTTFVGTSGDRNWIAFGEGNSSPGNLMVANVNPSLSTPIVTQVDLRNQAAEQIFGVAIDRTGQTIAVHGRQSFFSAIDVPFQLRLQGIYADAPTGGAGIAYHPLANGNTSTALPVNERLAFVAAGDRSIHAVDISFFARRGRYELKHQLYGPLRVSLPMTGDDPTVILKLYGVSLDGGLTVIDLRATDILPPP